MNTTTVRTWADGFGRWYAEVSDTPDAPAVALRAITGELEARDALGDDYRVTVEPWDAVPSRSVLIFREQ